MTRKNIKPAKKAVKKKRVLVSWLAKKIA